MPDFEDYNMTGRTYRYMKQTPLFHFGYGLSYTTFEYGQMALDKSKIKAGESLNFSVPITNTGKVNGEEVVQVYLRSTMIRKGQTKHCAILNVKYILKKTIM